MTKCEGTTKEQALRNREKREALVRDERVKKLFCEYTLETESGKGVVLLDYNHAVDHVRHCLNSMKKFGSFATIKVEQEVIISACHVTVQTSNLATTLPHCIHWYSWSNGMHSL